MPIVFILLAHVATEFLLDGIYTSMNKDFYTFNSKQEATTTYFLFVAISLILIYVLFMINTVSVKGGKFLQVLWEE